MVELAGTDRLLPACTTPIQDGMSIKTASAKLTLYRRMAVELLLVERNHICSACVSNGHCELQSMARSLGITHVRYAYNNPRLPVDMTHQPLCSRSQSLHSVHALREGLRGGGGCACVGGRLTRHLLAPCQRPERRLGKGEQLHRLRQVRAGLPDRRSRGKRLLGEGDGQAVRSCQPSCRAKEQATATVRIRLEDCSLSHCRGHSRFSFITSADSAAQASLVAFLGRTQTRNLDDGLRRISASIGGPAIFPQAGDVSHNHDLAGCKSGRDHRHPPAQCHAHFFNGLPCPRRSPHPRT